MPSLDEAGRQSNATGDALFRALCFALEIDAADVTYEARARLSLVIRSLGRLRELDLEAVRGAGVSWRALGWNRPLRPEDVALYWPELAASYRRRAHSALRRVENRCPECETGGGLHVAGCSLSQEAGLM